MLKDVIFNLLTERARRARMREERQWLMASGEFVPDELKMSFNKEEENRDSDTERRPASTRNKTAMEGEDIGLEERDEDLYTGMFKGRDSTDVIFHRTAAVCCQQYRETARDRESL